MRWLIAVSGSYWKGGQENTYCFAVESGSIPRALAKAADELTQRTAGVARTVLYEPLVITSAFVEVIQCP